MCYNISNKKWLINVYARLFLIDRYIIKESINDNRLMAW